MPEHRAMSDSTHDRDIRITAPTMNAHRVRQPGHALGLEISLADMRACTYFGCGVVAHFLPNGDLASSF